MNCLNKINPFVDFIHHSLIGSMDSEEEKEERREATRQAYKKLFKKDCQWLDGGCTSCDEDKPITLFVKQLRLVKH